MRFTVALSFAAVFCLAACKPQENAIGTASTSAKPATANTAIDQANLCEVSEWNHDTVKAACKPGQKVVYLPRSFGNEQLPIIFAAVNCDLRYQVALTTGAVTCIYGPITPTPAPAESTPAKPSPAKTP